MESFNLGAVLFALLLLLWVAYALPRTASRRDVMGRARAAERTEISPAARDLSAVVHSRRPTREASASMSQDRLLLRPADPTSRPRFHTDPGSRIDPFEERARSRRLLTVVLSALAVGTIILTVLAVAAAVPWWVAGLSAAGLGIYLVGLRRAELERRARSRTAALARQDQRERESEKRSYALDEAPVRAEITAPLSAPVERAPLEETAERATRHVAAPGEWTPRPVPRPAYTLRGEVDDLATRHAAHRESVGLAAVPLEVEGVEELEAVDEDFAPAADLHLDEVLARRRA
ncbi:MAG TPA: hypothetical protein H9786_15570 [Candidatus Brachybacterium merdavium]|uniref:Uncharacterized protein n=1 Tax=Candidatus Brachybacterium merdavium TaxID=2838513 RepID=A0A9D2RQQ0_9MICO|nr:hypothetical protein [Candidatus Brachybacterium merdavium]